MNLMKYIHSLYIGLLSLLFVGCQEEQLNNMQTGGFQISLQDVAADITTKTLPKDLEDPIVSNFQLKITNEVSGTSIYNGAYTSNLIPASTGVYSITATHGDNPPLAKDNPYYKGDTTGVELEEDQVASVKLKCRVANALASVVYTSEAMFKEVFTDYGVKVGIGKLTVDLENGTTESAYYQAGSIPTFTFVGTLKGNGKEVTKVLEDTKLSDPSTFAAGQHCKITLSLSTTTAGVNLDIEKVEAIPVTITATIPMEWLPAPKVSATGFDEKNTLTIYETEEASSASIDFNVAQPLQDLYFKLKFDDENLSSLNKGEGAEYQLSEMSEEEKSAFTSAGIILPSIGSTEPQIIFSEDFISKLLSKNDGTVSNVIVIDSVKANDRINKDESPLSYTIAVNKPEFKVSVNPANCWSREFTIDEITVSEEGNGNLEKIKENLIYQYYNGNDWVECTTRDNVKGRTQQFKEAAESIPTKEYKVRALFRGAIASSEATATLETPTQLPNSNLDEWSYTESSSNNKGNEGSLFNSRYTYIPIYKLTSSFWSTNNDYTTRYNNRTFGRPYNCFPAVSYVPGRLGGKAAELRNTASGAGNTNAGSISVIDDRNKVAGILFTGDFECESGGSATNYSYTKTNGKEFESRPTSLKFWYKYLPYTSDTWQAHIELWDKDKNIIIQQDFQSSLQKTDYEEVEIKLDYNNQQSYPICKYIYIIFQSTITEGENMPFEKFKDTYVLWKDEQQYTYNELHVGSILTIDDISLVYDK